VRPIEPFMTKQPGFVTNPTRTLTVLSVSPLREDHLSLQGILDHSRWKMLTAHDRSSALPLLAGHDIAVVVCEADVQGRTWIDLLEGCRNLLSPPSLIVASKFADGRLWAEALNLGAWDVLAKPFNHIEVIRSVKSAWQRWHDQIQMRAVPMRVMSAAG